jgi:uncharacterized protein YbbK (DUF523 family)
MGSHITTEDKIKIGISSCLLGEKVRFDASHKHDPYLTETLGQYFEWVPVCPEYEVGMGIPREAVRLVGEHELPRMVGSRSGKDWTETMNSYAKQRVKKLLPDQLCGFILKSRSPSCGMERVTVYQEKGPGAKRDAVCLLVP